MTEITVVREGRIFARPSFGATPHDYAVRELSDGSLEYYHPQLSRWCEMPSEWRQDAKSEWNSAGKPRIRWSDTFQNSVATS